MGQHFGHKTDEHFGRGLIVLLKKLNISSVTDFGCGNGAYVSLIYKHGIIADGFDGNPETGQLDISGGHCIGPVDLTSELLRPWNLSDAVISIEVGEHIPVHLSESFINNLAGNARKVIILSWGIPGQGGKGHVNGQTAKAIAEKMQERGWMKNEKFTMFLQEIAQFHYLKRNLQVFYKCGSVEMCTEFLNIDLTY